ncbi:MAG TPA: NAD(P)/FAD-dependent oxidoreductase [Acidobacteriaceae bacterium]
MAKTAIIIGAGPAGLTAALELLRRTNIQPIVLEASQEIGGISRTIRYKGNRMDIGGHRFFSKSDRVMQWWMEIMPPEVDADAPEAVIRHQGQARTVPIAARVSPSAAAAPAPADADRVMLIRPRKSRIYYLRRFFDYPIKLSGATLQGLGATRTVRVGVSYLWSRFHQIAPETSLEDFLINRFGRELYLTFFKSYTEKVWGTPCREISAEWGAQRIKGLSLTTAVKHFLKKSFSRPRKASTDLAELAQKDTDTSLIERFMYPKLGPGQLWEHVAAEVTTLGGQLHMGWKVIGIQCAGDQVTSVQVVNAQGEQRQFTGDYFFSTMPMRELVQAMDAPVPANVREVSDGLQYRDFITVGLLVDRLKVTEKGGGLLKDTWIYVQEPDVLLGRLQIFNNWSPHLVSDPDKVWIGLEYFCYETDDLWKMEDDALKQFAIAEVAKIGLLDADAVSDAHVVRVPKTYPAYFGTYDRFAELRTWTDTFDNLFLVGRNGMHKYNNQDHSMLTAMTVVDGLCNGYVNKAALWEINTEQDYHEEKVHDRVEAVSSPSALPQPAQ